MAVHPSPGPHPPEVRTERRRSLRRVEDRERFAADLPVADPASLPQDRVHWSAVWAGLFTALTAVVLLNVLGLAIGLSLAVDWSAAGNQGPLAPSAARNAAIWTGLAGVLAFLLGGYVAGGSAAVFDRAWGAWNGAMVFILALPLSLLLASVGLSGLLGTIGQLATGLAAIAPGQPGGASTSDAAQWVATLRSAAWWTVIGSMLALGAAALGGFLGTHRQVHVAVEDGQATVSD
jgi:hypothetical protein